MSLFKKLFSTLIIKKKSIAVIQISQTATNRLVFLISNNQDSEKIKGIRLGVKKRGCSGLSYILNYIHNTPEDCEKVKNDEVIVCNNTSLFIDPKAIMTIVGTNMDYVETNIGSEFTFTNPNSKGDCGCGESFTT